MLPESENGRTSMSVARQRVVRDMRRPRMEPLYPKLRPGPRTSTAQSVASNQRARLYGAMIELVALRGYARSTVSELCALAGVSKRTMYERFPGGKEQCFLATYDILVHRAQMNILGGEAPRTGPAEPAGRAEPAGPRLGLGELAEAFAREVIGYPNAAWLVLVEALGAGPEGPQLSERVERTRCVVERVLSHSLRVGADAPAPARSPLRAIVVEGTRLLRRRLREGRVERLEAELAQVCLAAIETPPPPR
jgi:AcrR family transcriptional regulator